MLRTLILAAGLALGACSGSGSTNTADGGGSGKADKGSIADGKVPTKDKGGSTKPVGQGVFLYHGSGGGGPDHNPNQPKGVYTAAGIKVADGLTLPANLADNYGCLVLLNPRQTLPASMTAPVRDLVQRGGRLVSVVDHSGYGGHDQAAALLKAVGSSMRSNPTKRTGYLDLILANVPELTAGVTKVQPFYAASVAVGQGLKFGVTSDGYVAMGYEKVGAGDVLIVGDASMFGYALGKVDNKKFITNFANLRK